MEHWSTPQREDSEEPLKAWYAEAMAAAWKTPADVKAKYKSASIVGDNRVVFNIAGNKYRLIVHINYQLQIVLVKFVGTHAEYDEVTAEIVGGGKK
ncbi:type II toxin-antitoxin system HigB family toxin [Sphingomonas sp. BK069]|uniref:type II toxin-antitoxin system HigB family toxin n=1 Tax=Sphingomonas sp. BK069 TaxID=2586979 RepID=UPI0017CC413B|nr:type II toxin-antitoxin system HigB family toxin [Sphingomonas sp. BK069]MBB3348343.1 mRNA interferase HigB [Sphingomonas sp. BK069]